MATVKEYEKRFKIIVDRANKEYKEYSESIRTVNEVDRAWRMAGGGSLLGGLDLTREAKNGAKRELESAQKDLNAVFYDIDEVLDKLSSNSGNVLEIRELVTAMPTWLTNYSKISLPSKLGGMSGSESQKVQRIIKKWQIYCKSDEFVAKEKSALKDANIMRKAEIEEELILENEKLENAKCDVVSKVESLEDNAANVVEKLLRNLEIKNTDILNQQKKLIELENDTLDSMMNGNSKASEIAENIASMERSMNTISIQLKSSNADKERLISQKAKDIDRHVEAIALSQKNVKTIEERIETLQTELAGIDSALSK